MDDYHKVFKDKTLYYEGYVDGWSSARWNRLNAGKPWEPDISAALLATNTPLERLLIEFFCQQIGHTITDIGSYRLMGSGVQRSIQKLRYTNGNGEKSLIFPDMFLVAHPAGITRNHETDEGKFQLIAAVELKRSASVNGRNNYCPQGKHSGYSNQIICYANNCWIDPRELSLLPNPPQYIWLAPQSILGKGTPSGGIRPTDADARLQSAYPVQEHAWRHLWTKVALEDLIHSLTPYAEAKPLAKLIQQWATNY